MNGDSKVNLAAIVDRADAILEEYAEMSVSESMWMDWGSDFYHGANWQILPVFASKSWLMQRYEFLSWESVMSIMAELWPRTLNTILSNFDMDQLSLIGFSRLCAGSELQPHEHNNKGHLIFHMGVEIPNGDVGIQTSDGIHEWNNPKDWLVFDDNQTHHAWNRTDQDRVVLYLDFLNETPQ